MATTGVVPNGKLEVLLKELLMVPAQLSVAPIERPEGAAAEQVPGSVPTVTVVHETVGFSSSVTVTIREQLAELPLEFVAVATTIETPTAKLALGLKVLAIVPGQLSLAVMERPAGAAVTQVPGSAETVIGVQVTLGGSASGTTTAKVQITESPAVSVEAARTFVVPRGKLDDLVSELVRVPGQLSVAENLRTGAAETQLPGSVFTETAGQVVTGG